MDLDAVLGRLDGAGVWLDPGLTGDELVDVERRFGFTFCADHRALLTLAVPVGDGWPDWLDEDEGPVRAQLAWPVEGVLVDVLENGFWPASWGPQPADDDREAVARDRLLAVPTMVPVWSHRYLPSGSATGVPVFSIYQTDVITYGSDLADYLEREFLGRSSRVPTPDARHRVPFWSDLVDGVGPADL